MPYDFSLSLAMIFFDLVILLNLTFNYGKLDRNHRIQQQSFLFLTLSCLVDVIVGILSQVLPEFNAFLLRIVMYAFDGVALIMLLRYASVFVSQVRAHSAQKTASGSRRLFWYVPALIAVPIIAVYYFYHITRPQLLLWSFALSVIAYLLYFLSELPLYEQLEERLTDLTTLLTTAEEAAEHAQNEDMEKNDFLANMSHEIRTPLNSILGMNEMILREAKEDAITGYARVIGGAGDSLLAIVNDILDFSRIESGDMQLSEETYHLGRVLDTVYNMISLRASDKGLTLHMEIDEDLPDLLKGDELRITQILTNLLSNAVKYTPQGDVTLRLGARERTEINVLLKADVIDTGIGIREEDLPRLFDSFARFDEEKNRTIEGTGLGLAITRNLTHLMGGEIRVDSVYQQGSTFTALIPQAIAGAGTLRDYNKEEGKERSGEPAHFTAPDARILVVDDTKINLRVVEMLLKQTRVQVQTALSGKQALTLLKDNFYHIILLDHMMPEMDGIETLRRIQKMPQFDAEKTKIIALTANAVAGAREEYLAAGFDDYLSKPVEPLHLEEALMKYLPEDMVN